MASTVTGDQTRDEALPTSDWFSVATFPCATFVSKTFRSLGKDRYQAIGTLTIRGVARTVTLLFHLAIKGDAAQMQDNLVLDRRLFGVEQGQFAGVDTVQPNVTVQLLIRAKRAAG